MSMKFVLEKSLGVSVQSCEPGEVVLHVVSRGESGNQQERMAYQTSVALLPQGEVRDWPPARFEELTAAHFDLIAEVAPELVILGTGNKQRFPAAEMMRQCTELGIGLEVMDTQAACRTYNIVQSEGRKVMALLIVEP